MLMAMDPERTFLEMYVYISNALEIMEWSHLKPAARPLSDSINIGFKRVCDSDANFKWMVQDCVFWHDITSGRQPSQLLGSLVQEAVEAVDAEYVGGKFWARLATRCLFSEHATCVFEDKNAYGLLQPAINVQQVDDDQWVVITRGLKTKLLHGFQMLPFNTKECDTVAAAALRHVPEPTVSMNHRWLTYW